MFTRPLESLQLSAYGRRLIKLEGDIAAIIFLQTPKSTMKWLKVKQICDRINVYANIIIIIRTMSKERFLCNLLNGCIVIIQGNNVCSTSNLEGDVAMEM